MKNSKKETTTKLNDSQKHWLGLVDIRVNALPFDFIKRTYTVDSLGKEHFDEYKINEYQVPQDKREEVALARVEGLSSIRDYIQSNGSKEQKFHLDSSIKGALLYASSLGIDTSIYEDLFDDRQISPEPESYTPFRLNPSDMKFTLPLEYFKTPAEEAEEIKRAAMNALEPTEKHKFFGLLAALGVIALFFLLLYLFGQ